MTATADLADLWRWMADQQFHGNSPLYERIARAVAEDEELLGLVLSAPPAAHLPLNLFAAVRYLLLDGLRHPLEDVYRGVSDDDPGPLILEQGVGSSSLPPRPLRPGSALMKL